MNFEDYLLKQNARHRDSLRLVHDECIAAHPGMQLVKKWGLPVFMLKKNIAYLDDQKDRPLLGVMDAKKIPGISDILYFGNRKQVGHFYIEDLSEERFSELRTIIEIAVSYDLYQ